MGVVAKSLYSLWQAPLIKPIVNAIARKVIPSHWFMPVFVRYCAYRIQPLFFDSLPQTGAVRILVLNSHRYILDLSALAEYPDIELIDFPHDLQSLINQFFHWRLGNMQQHGAGMREVGAYNLSVTPLIQQVRADLNQYLCAFLPQLVRLTKIDGVMTCALHYVRDLEWQSACAKQHIPFFGLHKENMKDPCLHSFLIDRYQQLGYTFYGQRLFLYNELNRYVTLAAKICSDDVIRVVGSARFDKVYRDIQQGVPEPEKVITLFSSHHCIGLLQLKQLGSYFSKNPAEGFVEYFDLVHVKLAEFALQNPDYTVYIKTKWADDWFYYVGAAIEKYLNIKLNKISNIILTDQGSAQELIKRSQVVVGINSTTLLEAKLYKRPVVMPLFAEAASKYYENHIYFKNYYADVFEVVQDPNLLVDTIQQVALGHTRQQPMPTQMIHDYLGYVDGGNCERIIKQIKQDIIAFKPVHSSKAIKLMRKKA